MTRKRRSFSPEFKQEAARLVLDQGYTIPQTSVSLGIGESAIPHLSARRPLSWPSFDVGVGHAYWGITNHECSHAAPTTEIQVKSSTD